MRVCVRFMLENGDICDLGPGDLIGRLPSAALHIDDARISEAHALISLRGQDLKLLALRGRFAIDQKPLSEVVLYPGLRILIARDLELVVEDVFLPKSVVAIRGVGLPQQVLSGTCSITMTPRPMLLPRYVGNAQAWIWSVGADWRLRVGQADATPLHIGDTFEVEGTQFEVVTVSLEHAGQARTQALGAIGAPIHLIANYDTVHIHRAGESSFVLTGISARILSELVACAAPISWKAIAKEIWRKTTDDRQLRRKWDISLSRLRSKLKDYRIRPDLVRSDRSGHVELFLTVGDRVEDRT